jgi:HK97 family phage portal protein
MLLRRPNGWQSTTEYFLDATERLVLWGNFYAFKARGLTGPIRRLDPLLPGAVQVEQDAELDVKYRVTRAVGDQRVYDFTQMHHVRGPARDGVKGDSPVMDVREAIALEIAAEKFGGSLFGNGAMPGVIMQYAQGSRGHKTEEEREQFINDFQNAYGRRNRFKAMLLPLGIEIGQQVAIENDKAQFLETRTLQRNIIAGAFGVPPHLTGDLSRATFSNIEHQSIDFIQAVILPYCRMFESAMERDLLTPEDISGGVIIRFNLDGALRGDFKSRQEGLQIMRQNGVVSANDWREHEGMNPRTDPGGDQYWDQGPSGQNSGSTGEPVPEDEENANGAA